MVNLVTYDTRPPTHCLTCSYPWRGGITGCFVKIQFAVPCYRTLCRSNTSLARVSSRLCSSLSRCCLFVGLSDSLSSPIPSALSFHRVCPESSPEVCPLALNGFALVSSGRARSVSLCFAVSAKSRESAAPANLRHGKPERHVTSLRILTLRVRRCHPSDIRCVPSNGFHHRSSHDGL